MTPAWQPRLLLCNSHNAEYEASLHFKRLTVCLNRIMLTGYLVAAQPLA